MFIKKKTDALKLPESPVGFLIFVMLFLVLFLSFAGAVPVGPDNIVVDRNETKSSSSGYVLNTSGGYITVINLTASVQNPRWKAFVGRVSGSFTLDDSGGSTIYDWSIATIAGEVYATRNSSTITWSNITCASVANLEDENDYLGHTSSADNLTATFNISSGATHAEFFVGVRNISVNSCPTLNTYVANSTQDTDFEEIALFEYLGGNMVFATMLEDNTYGYDNSTYDFQMIVPEIGTPGFDGATAYYLYVELS